MSHFTVLVITSIKNNVEELISKESDLLLAPYSENLEVDEYDKPCYCLGSKAREEVNRQSENKFGSWNDVRAKFQDKISPKPDKEWGEMTEEEISTFQDAQNKAWEEFTKDKREFDESAFESHSLKNTPDPECCDCHGKGTYRSTQNPDSKWDWYCVGGRWSGECHVDKQNIFPVKELVGQTFAVVTPDGKWYEKGEMGWWAVVSNEKKEWPDIFKKLIEPYNENYSVLMDCHI